MRRVCLEKSAIHAQKMLIQKKIAHGQSIIETKLVVLDGMPSKTAILGLDLLSRFGIKKITACSGVMDPEATSGSKPINRQSPKKTYSFSYGKLPRSHIE